MQVTHTIQPARGSDIHVLLHETYGPLGAFRGKAAAERCLASYADVEADRPRDITVRRDLDTGVAYHIPFIAYDRPVRR